MSTESLRSCITLIPAFYSDSSFICQSVCLDARGVLEKAKETPLLLEGNFLTVSSVFVPTHDQSILLAKNLNPKTNKETFKNFIESTKNADVFNIVFGKDDKAIVILKSAIGGFFLDVNIDNICGC